VPAVVVTRTDRDTLLLGLVENVAREICRRLRRVAATRC